MSNYSIDELKSAYKALSVKHDFKPGDIVDWKKGLKNKKRHGPFIVVDVLAEAIFDEEGNSGSPYFREPLDIMLGKISDEGVFLIFHYDSRRFEPVE